jgi:hypothetical protein
MPNDSMPGALARYQDVRADVSFNDKIREIKTWDTIGFAESMLRRSSGSFIMFCMTGEFMIWDIISGLLPMPPRPWRTPENLLDPRITSNSASNV